VASAEEITSFNLGMIQWAQGDLLNNPNLGFETYFAAQSMREIQMSWMTPPEIALSGCTVAVSPTLGNQIFN
jgi:hypothetical protein